MVTVTPNYYKDFKCIADKCRHTCCVGWEIEIDDSTLCKYKNLNGDFAKTLKSHIVFDESPHFKLDKDERCPFLNKNGLCDIITNLGEEYLCQICNDHPRFRNFYDNYVEIGLGLCCEVATKLILTRNEKFVLNLPIDALQIPLISFREKIFCILQDRTKPLDERLEDILKLVGASFPTNIEWYSVFNNLEKLDAAWDKYLHRIKDGIWGYTTDASLDIAYEQLVVYLIFRHFLDCQYDDKIQERVLFAVLIYKVIKTMNRSNTLEELLEIARIYSCEIEYSDQNINELLSALSGN